MSAASSGFRRRSSWCGGRCRRIARRVLSFRVSGEPSRGDRDQGRRELCHRAGEFRSVSVARELSPSSLSYELIWTRVRFPPPPPFDSRATRARSWRGPDRASRRAGWFCSRSQPPRDATMFVVYILECVDGSFYVGQTNDLSRRMKAHNDGTAARFTRERRQVRLVYAENLPSGELAVRRERQLKGWTHAKKRALIHGDVDQIRKLSRSRSKMSE